MSTAEFLSHVRSMGVNLWVDGDDLRYSAPKGAMTQDLRAELAERKVEILGFLRETHAGGGSAKSPPETDEAAPEPGETSVAPRTPAEEVLAGIWVEVLGVAQVGIHDNFFELGGDSLLGLQIIASANQAGLRFVPHQILVHQTIAELAAAEGTLVVQAEQGLVTGPVPLTPIQHIVFSDHPLDPVHPDLLVVLLEARRTLDPALAENAVRQLLVHHDVLRTCFVRGTSGWQQFIDRPDETVPFSCVDLSALPKEEQSPAIEAAVVESQACMDLSESPLRVVFFALGADRPSCLLIIIHHLVTDGYSQRILLEDLQTAYKQLSHGETIRLPAKTTSFKHWAERLAEYVQSPAMQQELFYWHSVAESCKQLPCLPVDYPGGINTLATCCHLSSSLSAAETDVLLREILQHDARIIEVLLLALVEAFGQWTGRRLLTVEVMDNVRGVLFDELDLSRTMGYFSTHYPVFLDLRQSSDWVDALQSIKEQFRRIPNRGIGYGLLCYLSKDVETAKKLLVTFQVFFNYLGFRRALAKSPKSSLFRPARESARQWRIDNEQTLPMLIEVTVAIAGGQLRVDWRYSEQLYQRSTIEGLANSYLRVLQALIAHR